MAGVSLDTYGASFIKYLPRCAKTLNVVSVIRNIPTGKFKWEGSHVVQKVHVQRNSGVGYTDDGGHIVSAGGQGYIEAKAARKFLVGQVLVTDGLLASAASSSNAAVSVGESELTGMMNDIKTHEEFCFSRDGTGVVGLLGSVTNTAGAYLTTPITMDDARGIWDGKTYEIRDAATPTTIHGSFTASKVPMAMSANEAQVYLTANLGALGQAQNDFVCWGSGIDSSYGKAITGLDALIDDSASTFQGVNVSNYPRYASYVNNGGGVLQNLTPSLLRGTLAVIAQNNAMEQAGNLLVYTSVWSGKTFEEMYENDLRIVPDTKIAGVNIPTFQSSFGKFSLMTSPYCQYGKMFFIDRSQISRLVQKELDWRPGIVSGVFNPMQNYLGHVATALEIMDLYIEDRRTSAKLENLNVSPLTAY